MAGWRQKPMMMVIQATQKCNGMAICITFLIQGKN